MPKEKKGNVVLKDALSDLEEELSNLRKQKTGLSKQLKKTGSNIVGTQAEEEKLRNQIARLVAKEGILGRKRNRLKEKLDDTTEKISKVKHIKEELSEVEGEE
ncbi:hypothetical protein KY313_03065 [Candidatus Woesearchaeota archaeon]|jgi:predicted  nucleic acid-binding Zn-ribbon protein|nr:hypothetical protein [Candidatus Woesearchaeota archaeon]